jgi:hypothetical protein
MKHLEYRANIRRKLSYYLVYAMRKYGDNDGQSRDEDQERTEL